MYGLAEGGLPGRPEIIDNGSEQEPNPIVATGANEPQATVCKSYWELYVAGALIFMAWLLPKFVGNKK